MIVIKEDRTVERVRNKVEQLKDLIREAEVTHRLSQHCMVSTWAGYLNGLRMADTITRDEYLELYGELKDYVAGMELGREARKVLGL